jgi:DNA-binding transcriptional LysR family regulator
MSRSGHQLQSSSPVRNLSGPAASGSAAFAPTEKPVGSGVLGEPSLVFIAVRVSGDHRAAIVASPAYFKEHPRPKVPRDLLAHRCINFRHGHGGDIYRWEFEKGRKSLSVAVNGPLIFDDVELVIRAALDGIGVAFVSEDRVTDYLASRALVRVLEDWCQPSPDSSSITRAVDSNRPRLLR